MVQLLFLQLIFILFQNSFGMDVGVTYHVQFPTFQMILKMIETLVMMILKEKSIHPILCYHRNCTPNKYVQFFFSLMFIPSQEVFN